MGNNQPYHVALLLQSFFYMTLTKFLCSIILTEFIKITNMEKVLYSILLLLKVCN